MLTKKEYENGTMYFKDGEFLFEVTDAGIISTAEGVPYCRNIENKGYFDYPDDIRKADTENAVNDFIDRYTDDEVTYEITERVLYLVEENGFGHDEHVKVVTLHYEAVDEWTDVAIYGERYYEVQHGTLDKGVYISKEEFDESEKEYREFIAESVEEEKVPEDVLEESWEELEEREWRCANGIC